MTNGQAIVPAIVIEGTREDWPGGPQTFGDLPARREPDDDAFWFSSELCPGDNLVEFRITYENIQRMRENTPEGRGGRLIVCLKAWVEENQDRQLAILDAFGVFVSDAGDTRIEHRLPL